ncbi:uncharacterized protein [Penaeus vannamei]|uniref:uncharacterized protein n=1 Tax=Penaeus vannamei TaxID=6689 RepID=UPI00387F47B6
MKIHAFHFVLLLDVLWWPEQSGFTPVKSTVDRISALRVTVERRREFGRGLLAAYIDLKKALDTGHRETLWEILILRGNIKRIIGLIASIYTGSECCKVWQSYCPKSLWNNSRQYKGTDLDFADDVAILSESLETLVVALDAFSNETKPLGLDVSWTMTKIQVFGDFLGEPVRSVRACGEDIEVTEGFKYLGNVVHNYGLSDQNVSKRIRLAAGLMNSLDKSIWRCRYLCRRTKLRVFKALIMPLLLYVSETWTPAPWSLVLMPFVICPGVLLAGSRVQPTVAP